MKKEFPNQLILKTKNLLGRNISKFANNVLEKEVEKFSAKHGEMPGEMFNAKELDAVKADHMRHSGIHMQTASHTLRNVRMGRRGVMADVVTHETPDGLLLADLLEKQQARFEVRCLVDDNEVDGKNRYSYVKILTFDAVRPS